MEFSARHLSDIARFNRVEGLALGSGFLQRIGGGFAVAASGRYGFSDKGTKGRGALEYHTGAGSSLILAAERQYRDVSDEQETSLVRNTIASQEFGSDYTDTYDVRAVSLAGSLARFGWRPSFEFAYERHEQLTVHARPANGRFESTVPALSLHESRLTIGLDRPSSDTLPAQHLAYLGGPTTGPGYEFHEFVGRGGVSQRIEYRFPAPFIPIPLGRFGRAPGTITLAPFATAVWIDRSAPFKAARQGWYPSVGLGALTVFDVLRLDVARGLRKGRWTFSADIGRDFWSVL